MEKRIIFATGNEGKMKEIRMILADIGVPVLSMKEAGIHADIVENGTSFEENAVIKARAVMELTGSIALADDSGLEIDWLNGEPGIYSARYMGEDTSYEIKNQNSDRPARRCAGRKADGKICLCDRLCHAGWEDPDVPGDDGRHYRL